MGTVIENPWRHARWYEPHAGTPASGSTHTTRDGRRIEAECATCGEVLILLQERAQ